MGSPNELIKSNRLFKWIEDIFPNEFIEDNLIIRPDGNISAGFLLDFPSVEEVTEDEIFAIEDSLEKVFSRLPIGTVVHFQSQFYTSPESDKALEETLSGFLVGTMINHLKDRAKA